MLKKVCGNDGDFATSEITSKRYVKVTWKFVKIWSSTYQHINHVKSTLITPGVPVGRTFHRVLQKFFLDIKEHLVEQLFVATSKTGKFKHMYQISKRDTLSSVF